MQKSLLNQKSNKIMTKKKIVNGDQQKSIYDWAEELLFSDDLPMFLNFCKQDMYEPTDIVSYTEFQVLKEKFEA
jgi:hypothetical protein